MALYVKRLVESLPAPDQNSIATDVRKDLYILMPMGQATIEQVARGRGMNVRTLQRRLEEANETFSNDLTTRSAPNWRCATWKTGITRCRWSAGCWAFRPQFVHALVHRRIRHGASARGVARRNNRSLPDRERCSCLSTQSSRRRIHIRRPLTPPYVRFRIRRFRLCG